MRLVRVLTRSSTKPSATKSRRSTPRTPWCPSCVAATGCGTVWSGRRWSSWRDRRRSGPRTPPTSQLGVKRGYEEGLGVGRQCSDEDLKLAFRKIGIDSHPDRHPDGPVAHDRFKEASEAYAVLSDPERRRSYDLFGHSAVGAGGPAVDFSDIPFADIFGTLFGRRLRARGRRERSHPGAALRYDLTITLQEAFTGVEKQIDVPRLA